MTIVLYLLVSAFLIWFIRESFKRLVAIINNLVTDVADIKESLKELNKLTSSLKKNLKRPK